MLTATQQYWLNWLNSYQDHRKINFTIGTVNKIAIKLGLTKFNIPVITVAGTNGKGSCVATIEACLSSLGYKVGSYTSPHMFSFNERIKINGQNAASSAVCDALEVVNNALDANQILSYFEMLTLAGLLIFKAENLDAIILEVGLGGRLDAVNVVENNIAVIVSIGLDHTQYLGDTIAQIAKEKAGIIKDHQSVICAAEDPIAIEIIKSVADAKLANFYQLDPDLVSMLDADLISFPLENAAAGLMAVKLLEPQLIDRINLPSVFKNLHIPGRFQVVKFKDLNFIFDCAHNPPATKWLANKLGAIPGKTVAIFSLSPEKNLVDTLQPLLPIINEWLVLPRLENIDFACEIVAYLKNSGYNVQFFKEMANAKEEILNYILQNLSIGDRVIICGSFFTVAEFLPLVTTTVIEQLYAF